MPKKDSNKNPRNSKKKRGGPHKTRSTNRWCSTFGCKNKPIVKFKGNDLCEACLNPDDNYDHDQDVENATRTGTSNMHREFF